MCSSDLEQASPAVGLPKRVVPLLTPGVADIAAHDQRFVEEHVLGIFGADSMPFPVLVRVCFVPFETGTGIERILAFRHSNKYISAIYKTQDEPEAWSASFSKVAYRKVTQSDVGSPAVPLPRREQSWCHTTLGYGESEESGLQPKFWAFSSGARGTEYRRTAYPAPSHCVRQRNELH